MRVVEAEDEGGALERMLPARETAALEVADTLADGAWRGVGALIGVVDAEGAAEGCPCVVVVELSSSPCNCWKPVSMGVGEAKMLCWWSLLASSAEIGGGCSDILLTLTGYLASGGLFVGMLVRGAPGQRVLGCSTGNG